MTVRRALISAGLVTALGCASVLGIEEAELDESVQGDAGALPAAGSPCPTAGVLVCGCSSDGQRHNLGLFCQSGSYQEVFQCPASQACFDTPTQTTIACGTKDINTRYAVPGGPCPAEGAGACSFDLKNVLGCSSGKWVESRHCDPVKCETKTQNGTVGVACENGGYGIGDPCSFSAGSVVCSTDLAHILQCQSGFTVVKETCPAPKTCTDTGQAYQCM